VVQACPGGTNVRRAVDHNGGIHLEGIRRIILGVSRVLGEEVLGVEFNSLDAEFGVSVLYVRESSTC
jgi:hypothetical protein